MKLIDVLSGKATVSPGVFALTIVADLGKGDGEETFEFAYSSDDEEGLGPQVRDWINAHPQFRAAIPAYVAPPPTPEEVRKATVRSDAGRADLLTRLQAATPGQIDTWVDNNVTNLAQVRTVLKALLKLIALDDRV